jgi:hypothetical protein
VAQVMKLMNLMGVWPGGCLVKLKNPQRNEYFWIRYSCGIYQKMRMSSTPLRLGSTCV